MQMIQQNLAYILGGTLLFLVCSSKNILIYNEELLIALSFLAFIATSAHTMGDAIAETFQTRADQIQTELQAFFVAKETLYQEVKHQIQMQQTLDRLYRRAFLSGAPNSNDIYASAMISSR